MKFVSIFRSDPAKMADRQPDYETMAALIDEMRTAGILVDTGGVIPSGVSMRVRRDGDRITATDGPFTEAKELVGGFAVLNVQSKDEAIAWIRRFLDVTGDGVTELHEVTEFS